MNGTFIDSFFFIALLNPADRFHHWAMSVAQNMPRHCITTVWVLAEVADALSSPKIRQLTYQFLRQLPADKNIQVVSNENAWLERGLAIYGARPDKAWSLTDCISFAVMQDFHLTDALTGDNHFVQAGFQVLLQTK